MPTMPQHRSQIPIRVTKSLENCKRRLKKDEPRSSIPVKAAPGPSDASKLIHRKPVAGGTIDAFIKFKQPTLAQEEGSKTKVETKVKDTDELDEFDIIPLTDEEDNQEEDDEEEEWVVVETWKVHNYRTVES